MNEDLILIIFFAGFIILQRWVLPRFGIHTCLSPKGCNGSGRHNKDQAKEPLIKVKNIDTENLGD